MKEYNMLQVFALDKEAKVRHVDEVKRGLACDCICPVCKRPVIAKQGDIKGWHFSHTTEADCKSAGETALHIAAKQIIIQEKGLLVPKIDISAEYKLPDGRVGQATMTRPEMWLDFIDVKAEVRLGDIQPDVVGYLADSMLFVEIAVRHFVDNEKQAKLQKIGVPTLEIDLSGLIDQDINWKTLRALLFESTERKFWLEELGKNSLELEAKEMAIMNALSQSFPTNQKVNPPKYRLEIKGKRLYVTEYPFGLTVWIQYDEKIKEQIKTIAKSLGGSYRPQYKNWLFPIESKTFLISKLAKIADTAMELMT